MNISVLEVSEYSERFFIVSITHDQNVSAYAEDFAVYRLQIDSSFSKISQQIGTFNLHSHGRYIWRKKL